MNLKNIQEISEDFKGQNGKTVLLRCDLNITEEDNTRILILKPTINFILKQDFISKIIICSHFGRPKGVLEDFKKFSLYQNVLPQLKKIWDIFTVEWPNEYSDEENQIDQIDLKNYENNSSQKPIILLENLRFHQGEENNDLYFAKSLAKLADFYVNDAFSVSHRNHASVSSVCDFLPSYSGFLLQKEMEVIKNLSNQEKGFTTLIIGGAKIQDKIGIISNLLDKVDKILIGGGMIKSFLEQNFVNKEISRKIINNYDKFLIPQDIVESHEFSKNADFKTIDVSAFSDNGIIMDIGPETIASYTSVINQSDYIIWNGSMGVFEWPKFEKGTKEIALSISRNDTAKKYAGGGSTIEAINKFNLQNGFTHISSGGGAFLAALEGDYLPGIKPLLVE